MSINRIGHTRLWSIPIIFLLGMLFFLSSSETALACTNRRTPTPVPTRPTVPTPVPTPHAADITISGDPCDGEVQITVHDYTTFGAGEGDFCTCALNLPTAFGAVISAQLVETETGNPLSGFSFDINPKSGQGFNGLNPLEPPDQWTGFSSAVSTTIPAGIPINLVMTVQTAESEIPCEEYGKQLVSHMEQGGAIVGTSGADSNGIPDHHTDIVVAGTITDLTEPDPGIIGELADQAKELVAEQTGFSPDEIQIANSAQVDYELIGITAYHFKVLDPEGNLHPAVFSAEGELMDEDELSNREGQLHIQNNGKIEPALLQRLRLSPPEDLIEVGIWLNEPAGSSDPVVQRPEPEGDITEEEIDQLYAELDAQRNAAITALLAPIVQKISSLGVDEISSDEAHPVISASLSHDQIREIGQWDEVAEIYEELQFTPDLNISRRAVGADLTNSRGIVGSGVRVAQVEVGGRIATANPHLAGVVQNPFFSCPHWHATAVAGVIRSTHSTIQGVAPSVNLWAGGSCFGIEWQLRNRSTAAANWGARAINLSWGNSSGVWPRGIDRFYDDMVQNRWRTVVKSAGNGGPSAIVSSPGRAYNVITVGNYNDQNSVNRLDDAMRFSSSSRDPFSWHRDREKPEVAAPGTSIRTTSNNAPWTTTNATGTSFSAPHVTGIAALLMQRHAWLQVWPESIKAILMATARHNIEGNTRLSERDGAGGVLANLADDVARGVDGNWGGRAYPCSTPSTITVATMPLVAGRNTRVAIAWDTNPDYWLYRWRPSADLDLRIFNPSGSLVASSVSWDNTYEIAQFTPATSGNYTIRVRKYRCSLTPKWLGWAWHQQPNKRLYVSSRTGGNVSGIPFSDEDILTFDTTTHAWTMYFDGSDVGLSGWFTDVDAFHVLDNGDILMSFNFPKTLGGVTYDDSDIVYFDATSLGTTTAGSFSMYLDGSDVGLTSFSEDIDAIGFAPNGDLVVSTVGTSWTGVLARDEDMIRLTGGVFGPATSGTWSLYFDGSDIALTSWREDVNATWIDSITDEIHLSTRGNFSVSSSGTALSGDNDDVFICDPVSLGSSTACNLGLFWNGDFHGYNEQIDGYTGTRP